jgi:arsenate reductase-like glutaredoxin family protein
MGDHVPDMPAPAGPTVQMFGLPDSRATQAALRFFKERRVNVTFVDLRRKPIAPGELRRFVDRLGTAALLDTEGRRYKDLGLGYMRLGDDEIVTRLLADNGLLRLPLVRFGNAFTAGPADATWKAWLAAEKTKPA